jgi:hypothetical protein
MNTIVVERTVPHSSSVDFDDIVERELRDQINDLERSILEANATQWRRSLLLLKKRTEVQFTACRGRRFAAWHQYMQLRLDPQSTQQELDNSYREALTVLRKEQDWRHKANFFLSKIEQRLSTVDQ